MTNLYDKDFYAWANEQAALLRGSSWETTIIVQRNDLTRHMDDNPSLKSKMDEAIGHAYGDAYLIASDETGLPRSTCPWSFEQLMRTDFWPEHH
jgi:hypothetical protein